MTDFIEDLRRSLEKVNVERLSPQRPGQWGDPRAMSNALAAAELSYGGHEEVAPSDRSSVEATVDRFRKTCNLSNYKEAKVVCVAVAQSFGGWCILQDPQLLAVLLLQSRLRSYREHLRLFLCLLRGFWSFRPIDGEASPAVTAGWLTLRAWLEDQLAILGQTNRDKPRWLRVLSAHASLIAGKQLDEFGKDLIEGFTERFDQVMHDLQVPVDSWLRSEVIVKQMEIGARLDDEGFHARIGLLVDYARGGAGVEIPCVVSRRCLAILVSRYAACKIRREHIPLRDAAIAYIGNPWSDRRIWDLAVQSHPGTPDDEAREMVNGWLKISLIRDFFELLSEDQVADHRRLTYWLGFESAIKEMWFGLGADILRDTRVEYSAFRERARGRTLALIGGTSALNCAFLMHIGDYLIIEFGIIDNACFLFRYEELPEPIKCCLSSRDSHAGVDIADLKSSCHQVRLRHLGNWESAFDTLLRPLIGTKPERSADVSVTLAKPPRSLPMTGVHVPTLFTRKRSEIVALPAVQRPIAVS